MPGLCPKRRGLDGTARIRIRRRSWIRPKIDAYCIGYTVFDSVAKREIRPDKGIDLGNAKLYLCIIQVIQIRQREEIMDYSFRNDSPVYLQLASILEGAIVRGEFAPAISCRPFGKLHSKAGQISILFRKRWPGWKVRA